jgi:hypothetical protein
MSHFGGLVVFGRQMAAKPGFGRIVQGISEFYSLNK